MCLALISVHFYLTSKTNHIFCPLRCKWCSMIAAHTQVNTAACPAALGGVPPIQPGAQAFLVAADPLDVALDDLNSLKHSSCARPSIWVCSKEVLHLVMGRRHRDWSMHTRYANMQWDSTHNAHYNLPHHLRPFHTQVLPHVVPALC